MPTLATKRTMARANEPTAKRLRTLERAVRRNTSELKFIVGASVANGTAFDLTSLIVQGTGINNRIGDTINIKKVEVRFLGNAGLNRLRTVLYTAVDNETPPPLTLGSNFVQFIDTEQNKVWDEDHDFTRQTVTSAGTSSNVPLPGRTMTLRKTFSIPMKTRYRTGSASAFHNPVEVQAVAESSTATAVAPPTDYGDFIYKIWYYDA